MNKKTLGWLVALVVILLIVMFAVKGGKSTTSEPIKIGGSFILTGPVAGVGALQKNGTNMAVDEVNAQGGINGRKVELVIEDDGYDPKMSVSSYQALKLKGAGKFIIADGSPVVGPLREIVVKDGNLIFAPTATTPSYFDGSNLSCRLGLTAKNFGPGFTQLLQKKGYKSVVTLLPDNEYGRGLSDEFTKAYTATGGKILAAEFYNATAGAADYRTNITKLKAQQTQVDAMIVVNVTNTVEPMLKQIADLGWKKPIVSDYYTLIQNPSFKNISLAEGVSLVDYQYSQNADAADSDITKTFKTNYSAKYATPPVFIVAANYDVTKLILEGIKNVGEDPKKVADYISHLKNHAGATGNVTFNDDCEVSRDMAFRTITEGKMVDLK